MKLNNNSIKLILVSSLAAAVIGCSGGAGSSTTAGTTPPSQAAATNSHSGGHMHDMAMGTQGMAALNKLSDREFDVAFMSQMITHHQGAIDMAEQTLKVAQRPETKQEAQKVIDGQTREIAQMEGWLKDWYDTAPSKEQQDLMHQDMAAMMGMPIQDDSMFYDMMIPHHQGAVEMSQLAMEKSPRQELKELAAKMKQDQTEEIKKYQELARE